MTDSMTDGVIGVGTGEVMADQKARKAKKGQPNGFVKAWASVSCAPLFAFAVRVKSATDLRVLLALLGSVQYGNDLGMDARGVGAALGIHRANVSKSIKRLTECGVLDVRDVISGIPFYCFNPDFSWRGSGRSHVIASSAREKAAKLAAKEAREADNLARLRVARMRFMQAHPSAVSPVKVSSSGYKGVSEFRGKFRAQIQRQCKRYTLGTYDTAIEAHNAYLAAARELSIHKAKD